MLRLLFLCVCSLWLNARIFIRFTTNLNDLFFVVIPQKGNVFVDRFKEFFFGSQTACGHSCWWVNHFYKKEQVLQLQKDSKLGFSLIVRLPKFTSDVYPPTSSQQPLGLITYAFLVSLSLIHSNCNEKDKNVWKKKLYDLKVNFHQGSFYRPD